MNPASRIILFITAVIFFSSVNTIYSKPKNLNDSPAYVRYGFNKDWLTKLPEDQFQWKKVNPSKNGGPRTIRMKDLNLPALPKRNFLDLQHYKPKDFTILIPVTLTGEEIESMAPGLFLAFIGINWEIYVNGNLVHREVYLNNKGDITIERSVGHPVFYIKKKFLKPGYNILGFHIIGNPAAPQTGFHWAEPFLLGNYTDLMKFKKPIIPLLFNGIYLFIGLYHIFLFFMRRKETYNLFFGLFAIFSSTYMFIRSDFIYDIMQNTLNILKIELCVLFTIIPLFGSFLETILLRRISLVTKLYSAFSFFLIILTASFSQTFAYGILSVWWGSIIIPAIYYIGFLLIRTFSRQHQEIHKKYYPEKSFASEVKAFLATIYRTTPGNLIIGVIIAFIGMIFDILDAMFFSTGIVLSYYSFFILIISIMFILANRFQYIHKEVEKLNSNLKKNLQDLDSANIQLSESEAKYRLLTDGSADIIFTINYKGKIITANKAIQTYLGVDPLHAHVLSIFDLVHSAENNLSDQVIKEKIEDLTHSKKPVDTRVELKRRLIGEPFSATLRLELLEKEEGEAEILCKATPDYDDALLEFFESEKQTYRIGNYISLGDDITHRMTRNLKRFLPEKDIVMMRVAVREMVINAIEHGNLAITYDEKSASLENENYFELIMERQNDQEYMNRRVTIDFSINENLAQFRITDEGEGFDHSKQHKEGTDQANAESLQHGRGITMARNIFDEVIYNNKGNQVLLTKKIR